MKLPNSGLTEEQAMKKSGLKLNHPRDWKTTITRNLSGNRQT